MGFHWAVIMFLAGPFIEICFGYSLKVIGNLDFVHNEFGHMMNMFGTFIILHALFQLIPWRRHFGKGSQRREFRSDGFQIRNMWRRRHQFQIINENW